MCLCLYNSLWVILCACAYIALFTGHHVTCLCLACLWCMVLKKGEWGWLGGRVMDWRFESWQKQWENVLLRSQLSVLTLFQYPFHPNATTVTYKRSGLYCHKCRWQVSAKHTCILHTWLQIKWHCKLVHGCMVYTKLVPRQQQFHVAPDM